MGAELTLNRLQSRATRFLGWTGGWPEAIEPTVMCQESGDWLYNSHPWNALDRPPALLNVVAGQAWSDLPTDFGRYVKILGNTSAPSTIRISDMTEVVDARARGTVANGATFVGYFPHTGPASAGPRSAVRLELGPVPTSDITEAFILGYKACFTVPEKGDDHILVPRFMQSLFVRVFCEWIAGYERSLKMPLEKRLDQIVDSALWQGAVDFDDTLCTDVGPMRGSAESIVSGQYDGEVIPVDRSQVTIVGF